MQCVLKNNQKNFNVKNSMKMNKIKNELNCVTSCEFCLNLILKKHEKISTFSFYNKLQFQQHSQKQQQQQQQQNDLKHNLELKSDDELNLKKSEQQQEQVQQKQNLLQPKKKNNTLNWISSFTIAKKNLPPLLPLESSQNMTKIKMSETSELENVEETTASGTSGASGAGISEFFETSTFKRKTVVTTTTKTPAAKNLISLFNKEWFKHLLALFMIFIITSVDICVVALSTNQAGIKTEPLFISRSEAFKFVTGETISLPCEVTHPGSYVLAWKRGIAILTAGTVKVTPDPRIRLVNGYTLQIRDATPQDAGDYICQIATIEPREITHHVEILVPPKIHHVTSGGHLQVKKGSPVRLECAASGNPTPNITWTRKNNVLPNGEDKYISPVYIIENMDRHKGGIYICTANNGVGQSASSQIILHVLYPPEISVEKAVVHTGEGQEAILVCIVHGESQPEVLWFKDTMQIDTTERHIMENRGARHTLIIRKVHATDFGNYSCVADNQLGKTRKTITLTGKPNIPTFRSAPISQWRDKYNISWIVNSYSPIEEYKLYYRPSQNTIDNTFEGNNRNFHSHSFLKRNQEDDTTAPQQQQYESFTYHSGYSNGIHWSRNEWRDVILPAIPPSHRYTQGMSYVIRGLEQDQQYEAKVQSRNRFGWSDFSEPFFFSTTNIDTEMRDLSVTHYSSTSSSSSSLFLLSSAAVSRLICKSAFIQIIIFTTFKIL